MVGQYIDSSGEHGFLYSDSKYATIDDPLATNATYAREINNKGEIVGLYVDSSGAQHGFLYSDGKYTTINDPLGTVQTAAFGINDSAGSSGITKTSAGSTAFSRSL